MSLIDVANAKRVLILAEILRTSQDHGVATWEEVSAATGTSLAGAKQFVLRARNRLRVEGVAFGTVTHVHDNVVRFDHRALGEWVRARMAKSLEVMAAYRPGKDKARMKA